MFRTLVIPGYHAVGTGPAECQFDSDDPDLNAALSEDRDVDMVNAQYNTEEEAGVAAGGPKPVKNSSNTEAWRSGF